MKTLLILGTIILAICGLNLNAEATKQVNNLVMLDKDTIQLVGVIDDQLVSAVQQRVMESDKETLTFYIKSPGGSIDSGNNLIQTIKATGKNTRCVVDFAASMAFVFTQLACDERLILQSGTLMQHQAAYSLPQQPAERQKNTIKMIEHIVLELEIAQAKRMKITLEEFQKRRNNDYWLIGSQAVEANAADKVGMALCTKELIKERIRATRQIFIFTVQTERSACPILNDEQVLPPEAEKKST